MTAPVVVSARIQNKGRACVACDRPAFVKGYCARHYERLRRGLPLEPLLAVQRAERPYGVVPEVVCPSCGKTFTRTIGHRTYCSLECAVPFQKARNALEQKQRYWADPEAGQAASKRSFEKNREYYRAYMSRAAGRVCIVCGQTKKRSDWPKSLPFQCGACESLQKRTEKAIARNAYCRSCGKLILTGTARDICRDCYGGGVLTEVAKQIGVTRERVRQLVNKRIAAYAKYSLILTRPDAAALVLAERLGRPYPKVTVRYSADVSS